MPCPLLRQGFLVFPTMPLKMFTCLQTLTSKFSINFNPFPTKLSTENVNYCAFSSSAAVMRLLGVGCSLGPLNHRRRRRKSNKMMSLKECYLSSKSKSRHQGRPRNVVYGGPVGGQKSLLLLVVGEASADVQVTVMIYLFLYLSVS